MDKTRVAVSGPNCPGWLDAPPFVAITSAYQPGLGAVFFGVLADGQLWAISSEPNGWKTWSKKDWSGPGQPEFILEVAAIASQNGRLQIWAIDGHHELWSDTQGAPRFGPWERNWNNAPSGLIRVAAGRRTGKSTAAIWGIQSDFSLISCYQRASNSPNGANTWSPWELWPKIPRESGFSRMAPTLLNDGRAALWVLDQGGLLWCRFETEPGGEWGEWIGPGWNNAPWLVDICACEQGGNRGSILFGIRFPEFTLISTTQLSPGGEWSEWAAPGWQVAPEVEWATAAGQKDATVRIWASSETWQCRRLESNAQTSPGGEWGEWDPKLPHTH